MPCLSSDYLRDALLAETMVTALVTPSVHGEMLSR